MLKLMLILIILTVAWVLSYKFINPQRTVLKFKKAEKKHIEKWIDYNKISKYLICAVIVAEDTSFFRHHGFDFKAIKQAYAINNKYGRKVFGASTISQQTAKNIFLWQSKSWLRKGLEGYFTVLIELFWSKERIMEVYLNTIEYGNELFGAEIASKVYFKSSCSKLTLDQAALLAAILPNPRKWSLITSSTFIVRKKNTIIWRIKKMFNGNIP